MPMKLLPFDLEEEILCRVPFSSLLKFRSVCKVWDGMILDERFILKILSRMNKMSYSGDHQFIITHYPFISSVSINEEQQNVVDSPLPSLVTKNLTLTRVRPLRRITVYKMVHCEGLLLCVMDNQLLVWNPLLNETRWVKCGSDFHEYDDAYSLGYLSRCNDYRILRFRCASNSRNRPPRVEVCQLASRTWKVIDHTISSFDWVLKIPLSILSLRGTPHWIALREEDRAAFIQSFDFAKETFQPTGQLPFRYEEMNPIALEIYKGDRLSVLEQCHKTRKICIWFKHWLLPSSWTRLMVVDIPHFPLLHSPSCRVSTNFAIDKNGRLVVTSVEFDSVPINIYRVIGDNDFQQIDTEHVVSLSVSFSCSFVPSFVSLPGFSKQDTLRICFRRNRFN